MLCRLDRRGMIQLEFMKLFEVFKNSSILTHIVINLIDLLMDRKFHVHELRYSIDFKSLY